MVSVGHLSPCRNGARDRIPVDESEQSVKTRLPRGRGRPEHAPHSSQGVWFGKRFLAVHARSRASMFRKRFLGEKEWGDQLKLRHPSGGEEVEGTEQHREELMSARHERRTTPSSLRPGLLPKR